MSTGATPNRRFFRFVFAAAVALSAGAVGLFGVVGPAATSGPAAGIDSAAVTDPAVATLLLVGSVGARSRGMTGLVGWIVGGAVLGGVVGYAAHAAVQLPLSMAGAVGLGVALGGGLGGISHLLSIDEPSAADDESVTVDMANQSTAEPRPADLFDDHPDPVLYVSDAGGGPVVRAANDAYERDFDLPATAIEDAPLGDVLRLADDADAIGDRVADGDRIDDILAFDTPEGRHRYRVRSVAATDDGYLLFTPVED